MKPPRKLRLQVRRADLKIAAPIDVYTEAEIVVKFNPVNLETCSTFMVRMPMRVRDGSGRLRWNRAATALLETDAGITSSLDGERLLAGDVEEPERSRTGRGVERLEVFGYSDDQILASRNAWPVPSSDVVTEQDAKPYDIRNGIAEDVIKAYVDAGVGPAAPVARRVGPLVIPPSSGLGTSVSGRARFYNLADLCTDLCSKGGGLGWRVVHVGAELHFEVFQPRDRTKHARFSPALRNLESYRFVTPKDQVTRALALGGGQGTDRLIREFGSPVSWHKYREAVIDRRDAGGGAAETMTTEERAAAAAELEQAAADAVAKGQSPASFHAPVQDTPAVGFMREYRGLDRVRVNVLGTSLEDIVRQVSVEAGPKGIQIYPTVGVPGEGPDADLTSRLQAAERRLANLERSL